MKWYIKNFKYTILLLMLAFVFLFFFEYLRISNIIKVSGLDQSNIDIFSINLVFGGSVDFSETYSLNKVLSFVGFIIIITFFFYNFLSFEVNEVYTLVILRHGCYKKWMINIEKKIFAFSLIINIIYFFIGIITVLILNKMKLPNIEEDIKLIGFAFIITYVLIIFMANLLMCLSFLFSRIMSFIVILLMTFAELFIWFILSDYLNSEGGRLLYGVYVKYLLFSSKFINYYDIPNITVVPISGNNLVFNCIYLSIITVITVFVGYRTIKIKKEIKL